jgi:hypothetical protein
MKTRIVAALMAVLTLGAASAASAQDYRRGDHYRPRPEINVRMQSGRQLSFMPGDRMFYRLLDNPYRFRAGLTYSYTDRCNRAGCVVFVFDERSHRPIDRIFAPHLPDRRYAFREARDFDRSYRSYGRYDRDERGWDNNEDRSYRDGRDGRGERYDDDRDEPRDDYRGDRAPQPQTPPARGPRRGDGSGLEGGPER